MSSRVLVVLGLLPRRRGGLIGWRGERRRDRRCGRERSCYRACACFEIDLDMSVLGVGGGTFCELGSRMFVSRGNEHGVWCRIVEGGRRRWVEG